MAAYLIPQSLDEALAQLSARPGLLPLAGGTDVYPALRAPRDLLDLSAIPDLRGIDAGSEGLRIGAMTPWSAVHARLTHPAHAALVQAAREVGSPQIQAVGTIGGNLCNASPAADGTVALLALEARVEIAGPAGLRQMPLADFVTGVRRVALEPGELLTAILLPRPEGRSAFVKLGARRYLVISIAMVAAHCVTDAGGRILRASVAVGACSPVARRMPALESALVGARAADLSGVIAAARFDGLAPISDVRAPAAYRSAAVPELVRRALSACLEG